MISWNMHEIMGKQRLKIADVARGANLAWETVAAIYHGKAKAVALETLNGICKTLGCQPGDLLEYIPDEGDENNHAKTV